ncbi:MAG: RNA polymerase sigma factor, partial [Gemmataceae bacterium]
MGTRTWTPASADRQAEFDELYANHHREVWAMAYARVMDADLALDIMQEAFLRLWRAWGQQEEILLPRAWLMRVSRNLAEDAAKSRFRKHGTVAPEQLGSVESAGPNPLETLTTLELRQELREHLAKLPEADREILTLRYGLDYD